MEFAQFVVGFIVACVAMFFVLRNQVRKNEELKAYADREIEKLKTYSREQRDELLNELKAAQLKIAELFGKISK